MLKGEIKLEGVTKEDLLTALEGAKRQIKSGFYNASGTNGGEEKKFIYVVKIKEENNE